jgi:hypothetical protein
MDVLQLSFNRFSGSLPASLPRLPPNATTDARVSTLGLGHNLLTGTIPSILGRLRTASLDISSNKIIGGSSTTLLFTNVD